MHPRTENIESGKVRNLDVTESLTYQGTAFVPSATTDEKAKVSATDTTAGYLQGKLVAGTNVTLTQGNAGANETLTISSTASGITTAVDIQTFAASGTWTKPAGAKFCRIYIVGGGAGGGGGSRQATNTASGGGAGGSSGHIIAYEVQASELPSTVTVTIAANASGGAGSTADSTTATSGTTGNATVLQDASSNIIARAIGGVAGNGGGTGTATGGVISTTSISMGSSLTFATNGSMYMAPIPHATGSAFHFILGSGQSGNVNGSPSTITIFSASHILSGGCAGASISAANIPQTSGFFPAIIDNAAVTLVAAQSPPTTGAGGAGPSGTTLFQTSSTAINNFYFRSTGGGGGASGDASATIPGGTGGAGGIGCGGGGGGAARNGQNGGTGGAGGQGWVRIVTFM